jgi:hypothetical protein
MRDLDVLVRREHLGAAAETLEHLGFVPDEWYRPREWYLEHLHHLVPYRRGQAVVEIHHTLLPPSIPLVVSVDALWERSFVAPVAGVPARVLAPDDFIVHLALHLVSSHGFVGGLGGLRDLAEMLRHHGTHTDWERLERSVQGFARPVRAALEVTARLLGAPPLPAAWDALTHGAFRSSERRALVALARQAVVRPRQQDSGVVPAWFLRACLAQVITNRGWGARARAVAREAMATGTRRGRARGLGRAAALYGAIVHPWLALARRVRRGPDA